MPEGDNPPDAPVTLPAETAQEASVAPRRERQYVECATCGRTEAKLLAWKPANDGTSYPVVECNFCGLRYLDYCEPMGAELPDSPEGEGPQEPAGQPVLLKRRFPEQDGMALFGLGPRRVLSTSPEGVVSGETLAAHKLKERMRDFGLSGPSGKQLAALFAADKLAAAVKAHNDGLPPGESPVAKAELDGFFAAMPAIDGDGEEGQ